MTRPGELHILCDIARKIGQKSTSDQEITGISANARRYYSGELMVVGRAVNGWTKRSWTPSSLSSKKDAADSAHHVLKNICRSEVAVGFCRAWSYSKPWPSNWRNPSSNSQKSAFWRVIRDVVGELHIADMNTDVWPSHLIWSNLYKISPAAGNNPSGNHRSIQRPDCIDLLETEIRTFPASPDSVFDRL